MTPDRRCTTYSARPARLEREGDPEPWLGKQRASIRTSVRAEGPRLMSLVVHIVPFEMGARLPPGSHRQRDKVWTNISVLVFTVELLVAPRGPQLRELIQSGRSPLASTCVRSALVSSWKRRQASAPT